MRAIDDYYDSSVVFKYKRPVQPKGPTGFYVTIILMKTTLFIDGENFIKKMRTVFGIANKERLLLDKYNFKGLFDKALEGIKIDNTIFYFAHLKEHPDTKEKSRQLIAEQRLLKNSLQRQGFIVILSGRVRGQLEEDNRGKKTLIFKEKGVDVKVAVDMMVAACDGNLKTGIIGSSDSDLQPAIAELRNRNVECIYLGFEMMPNKGLVYTTNRTILIRNSEILEFENKA